jgi:hypothetical protein
VADPRGFTYAFSRLEQAIEELVGAGGVKERLEAATITLAPIFPDDFPAGHLRDEYADMTQEEAGSLAKSLFSLYTSAAEAVYGGLHGR